LWCVSRSPLMFGGNLPETDAFTLSLVTNPEVLAVDQQSSENRQVTGGPHAVWTTRAGRGAWYVALFNRAAEGPAAVPVSLADLGITRASVRDLWARRDLGTFEGSFSPAISA